jgi:hypothetical protein
MEVTAMVDEKKPSEAKQVAPAPETQNEGEGSRTAARRYDAGAEKMARSGKVEELARKAKEALDGEEGDELERAVNRAEKGPR